MTRPQLQLKVGESFIGGRFCVSGADVARAQHVRLMSNVSEFGTHDVTALRGDLTAVHEMPTSVVVDRAIAQMCLRLNQVASNVRTYGVANARVFGASVKPGEPLELLCTVGYRGRSRDADVFVTMFVEARRPNGSTALKFEVGVGIDADASLVDVGTLASHPRPPVAAA